MGNGKWDMAKPNALSQGADFYASHESSFVTKRASVGDRE